MSRELYAGVSGATAAWSQLDTVSHNLANVSTAGFKARQVAFQVAQDANNDGVLGQAYVEPFPANAKMTDGPLEKTDRELDLGLQGRGFFAVEDPNTGKTLLTRNGRFTTDSQGFVVTQNGERLRSSAGPVQLQPGDHLVVQEDGRMRTTNGTDLGMLEILDGDAKPLGATLWEAEGQMVDVAQAQQSLEPGERPYVRVYQNNLERSNVDPLSSMVELIEASRFFEAYQNIMQSSDEADKRLINAGRT